jgi:hypothetical protein
MWGENEEMNANTTVGTPMYMSPEMMLHHKMREKSFKLQEAKRKDPQAQLPTVRIGSTRNLNIVSVCVPSCFSFVEYPCPSLMYPSFII